MLKNSWIIEKIDRADSSQILAKENHKKGQMVLLLKEQIAGYGQKNRVWEGFLGNLFTTISFPCHTFHKNQITLLAVVTLGKTLQALAPNLCYQYKWVNDLLIDGKKVAGILCESQGDRCFLGMGVNLVKNPSSNTSSNLAIHGLKVEPEEFLSLFLNIFTDQFNQWLAEGFRPVAGAWKERAYGLGERVAIQLNSGEEITGTLVDLTEKGLVLERFGLRECFLDCSFIRKVTE